MRPVQLPLQFSDARGGVHGEKFYTTRTRENVPELFMPTSITLLLGAVVLLGKSGSYAWIEVCRTVFLSAGSAQRLPKPCTVVIPGRNTFLASSDRVSCWATVATCCQ